ncbi:hypothetical protein [Methanobrevibacter sp.]|uniref:hypothetical protein n=1 Tax=Methanobrevibacter sp. TaxID=66852 RepID=UPI0038909ED4
MKLIEIGIILIILLMIIGAVLTFSEDMTGKVTKTQETQHFEILSSEVVDNLINNPGNPENWEEYEKGTPGLAIINENGEVMPNSVSYLKFMVLGKNYKKLVFDKLFNLKLKSSMELSPLKSSISSVKIGEDTSSNNIYTVNRLVKCDFFKKYVIKDFQNPGKCNHNHNQEMNGCNYFKIFKGNLKNSDYYLIIEDNEDLNYFIDTTQDKGEEDWIAPYSKTIYLNDKIDFHKDTSEIVFIHIDKIHPKAVIVSIPKNFDKNYLNYDYFTINECKFILKAGF